MGRFMTYGFVVCISLLVVYLFDGIELTRKGIMHGMGKPEMNLEKTENQPNCHRSRRSNDWPCPQHYNVTFETYFVPSFKVELLCDRKAKSRCWSKCVQLIDPEIPKLKLRGIKKEGGFDVYYYQRVLDEEKAGCTCI